MRPITPGMRLFTLVVSTVFVAIGITMVAAGQPVGLAVGGFFALCALVAVFEKRLRVPPPPNEFRLFIEPDEIACEHPRRKREAIRWDDVVRIWYVTMSYGSWIPDTWLLFEGESGACSIPTDAPGFEAIWKELEQRFPGFDYKPIIFGGADHTRLLCWEREVARVS